MLPVLIAVILSLGVFVLLDKYFRNYNTIPGPKGFFLLENSLDFLMDPGKLYIFLTFYKP